MQIVGCDLHTRQQALAMPGTIMGEVANVTLTHEGNHVREFYSKLSQLVIPRLAGPIFWRRRTWR